MTEMETGNRYVGAPDDEAINEIASKALEDQIHAAIKHLNDGQNGQFDAVIALLGRCIGDY